MIRAVFTLIEVLIALSILALGVVAITQLISGAQHRSRVSQAEWRESHALSQAVEFAMLARPGETAPDYAFPFPEYRIQVEYLPPEGVLPDQVSDRSGKWTFRIMRLTLQDHAGKTLRTIEVNRIVDEAEL